MDKQTLKDTLGWGFLLWLIGYALGIMLFAIVPISMIGWVITPIGIAITLWVLFKKIKSDSLKYYALLAVVWTLIAIVFDYFSSSRRSTLKMVTISLMCMYITL